jgi:hypothetical protein
MLYGPIINNTSRSGPYADKARQSCWLACSTRLNKRRRSINDPTLIITRRRVSGTARYDASHRKISWGKKRL